MQGILEFNTRNDVFKGKTIFNRNNLLRKNIIQITALEMLFTCLVET